MWVLGVLALLVSIAGVVIALLAWRASDRSADQAKRSADMAIEADRQSKMPNLEITVPVKPQNGDEVMIFELRNLGPQDLESVVMYRPRPQDGLVYPIAVTGTQYAEDEIEAGPLEINQHRRITFCYGADDKRMTFRFRLECRAGDYHWTVPLTIERPHRGKVIAV